MISAIGVAAMVVGLVLILGGASMAWKEEKGRDPLRGPSEFVSNLAKLADALAKHPTGIRILFLGIVVFFLGGIVAGVSALTS